MKTLPAEFLLRKHNMEYYLTQLVEPKLFFTNLLPTAVTDTGEFPTVLTAKTAAEDMDDGVLSEPLDTAEASELTEIDISPINAVMGETTVTGYKFRYTDKFLKRSDRNARLAVALAKIAAGVSMKVNQIVLNGMIAAAQATVPNDLSDWDAAADPRADAIKLRNSFAAPGTPFYLDTVLMDGDRFAVLEEYYMSMDWPFNSQAINVDGTTVTNVRDSFTGTAAEFVGFDSTIPPGIVEKYLNPDFSEIRSQEMEAKPEELANLPISLLNVNQFKATEYPYDMGFDIWAELGYASQEPNGVMAGTL